jgi:hypothetical protein
VDREPGSSEPPDEPDATAIAVLVACRHRGPLTRAELLDVLPHDAAVLAALDRLAERGWLQRQGDRHLVTPAGQAYLDEVLVALARDLDLRDPIAVAGGLREAPTLPFAANTTWAEAVCVNIRVDPSALRPLVPTVFDLDLYDGWAFVSLAASRLKNFGVGRVPAALRSNFYQATYRAHVAYTDFLGRRRRGCYFVRSETNFTLMSLAANLLPEFRAHRCATHPIVMLEQDGQLVLTVDSGDDPAGTVVLVLDTGHPLPSMPPGSVFPSIRAAYDYLVDFHDAFAFDPDADDVLVLQIDRGDWDIRVVEPVDYYLGYVSDGPFPAAAAELDSVFHFTDVAYRWLPLLKERVARRPT